jgi:hypothetical protein
MAKVQTTSPVVPFFLAGVFGAATLTGVGVTLIFYFSQLQGWFFTRVW